MADMKPGFKKMETITETKKTLEDYIQDIKDLTIKAGGQIKTLERYQTGGKISSIELTLPFKVH